jgi:hypothetical protein
MTRVFAHPRQSAFASYGFDIGVLLFGSVKDGGPQNAVGNQVRRQLARLDLPIDQPAFDFLAIALAVAAADRFVLRSDADDGFGRRIELTVGLASPGHWTPLAKRLETALGFLSGDRWVLSFVEGGDAPPSQKERARLRHFIDLEKVDEVCLFSGGMDSLIGAVDRITDGHRPLLVSRSTRGDGGYQYYLRNMLPSAPSLSVNDDIRGEHQGEPSTRTRSVVFIALAACAASAIASMHPGHSVPLIIPENGFIALNPPLTRRRIGALSTRTVHPHFIGMLQTILENAGVPTKIENPLYFKTKGEALATCGDQDLIKRLISKTVSCGKWKRYWQQCGRCVPCLIRRAAFHVAGIPDETATTKRNGYRFDDLGAALRADRDRADVRAVAAAIGRMKGGDIGNWVIRSGPLPLDATSRAAHKAVAQRGLAEIQEFLEHEGVSA